MTKIIWLIIKNTFYEQLPTVKFLSQSSWMQRVGNSLTYTFKKIQSLESFIFLNTDTKI